MRVISGKARGRKLSAPKSHKVRPALDKVKEAIFNILFDVNGERVLDLFAGTGSMGIEALSRGAVSAVFIDNFKPSIESLTKNIKTCGFQNNTKIIRISVERAIPILEHNNAKFDIVFVDPPYEKISSTKHSNFWLILNFYTMNP